MCHQVPVCAVTADNRCVDSREQAFAEVAARQLNFLTVSSRAFAGFTGPQIDQHGAGPGSTVFVSYRKGPLTIGIRLVRGYNGDDYVMIAGMVDGGEDDAAHQRELKARQGAHRPTDGPGSREEREADPRDYPLVQRLPGKDGRPIVSSSGSSWLDENMSVRDKSCRKSRPGRLPDARGSRRGCLGSQELVDLSGHPLHLLLVPMTLLVGICPQALHVR